MPERSFSVKLAARVDSYVAAMKSAEQATTKFSTGTQANLTKLGGQMQSVGSKMTLGLSAPLVAAGGIAVKTALDFDDAFTKMQALAGVTSEEVDGLKESVLELSGETAASPQELAEALYFLRSSGLDSAEAMDALEMSAKASAAGLGSTATIADAVSSAMNAYATSGLTAAEATDTLVATARAGKAEPEELAGALGRILPIASELGVTFQDVGGAIASLSLSGNDASTSATLLSNILSKMLKPSQQGAEALAEVGMSADTIRASIAEKGLLATLEDLKARLGDAGFVRFLEDAQAVQGALALTGQNAETVAGTFDQVADSVGATDEAFDTAAGSSGFQMKQAWADLQAAMIQAGDVILPVVAGVAGALGDLASAFSELPGPAQTAVLGVAAFVIAVGPLLKIGGMVVENLKSIQSGLQRVGSMGQVAASGLIVLGIATVAFALNAQRAAGEAQQFADAIGGLGRAGDEALAGEFAKALVAGSFAGKDFEETLAEIASTSPGTIARLIEMEQNGGGVSRALKELGQDGDATREVISLLTPALAEEARAAKQAEETNAAGAEALKGTTEAGAEAVMATEAQIAAHQAFQEAMSGTGAASAAAATDIGASALSLTQTYEAASAAIGPLDSARVALLVARDAATEAASAADHLKSSWDLLFGAGMGMQEAVDGQAEAVQSLNERIMNAVAGTEGYTLSLDASTEAGRANRSEIRDNVTAIVDYAGAMVRAGESNRTTRQTANLLREQLINQVAAFTGSRDSAEDYVNQLGLTPGSITSAINTPGLDEAKEGVGTYQDMIGETPRDVNTTVHLATGDATSAANAFEQRLNSIEDETVTINVNTVSTTTEHADGGRVGRAGGIAGEAGPELLRFPSGAMGLVNQPTFVAMGTEVTPLGQAEFFARGTTPRVAPRPPDASARVTRLLDEAEDLVRLAGLTDDAAEATELLEKAREKAQRAADLHAKAIRKEAGELDKEVIVLRRHAEGLRDDAAAIRERAAVQADAMRSRASSLRDVVDAELALHDAAAGRRLRRGVGGGGQRDPDDQRCHHVRQERGGTGRGARRRP